MIHMARPDWMLERDVIDATHRVTINIRQHHIDEATSQSGSDCVAARCTLQALDAKAVWFYRSKAYVIWDDDGPIQRYQNSQQLIRNVIKILDDDTKPNSQIQPGLYDLLPPPPAQKLGVDRRAKKPGSRPPKRDAGHRVMGRLHATAGS
jgi:hypothetical protein